MKPFFSKYFFYLPIQYCRGESILKLLDEYKQSESFFPADLEQAQREKLSSLLKYVFQHVPYFQSIQQKHDLQSASNPFDLLSHIPIMTKQMYISSLKQLHSNQIKVKLDSRQTSGSSGVPLNITKGRDSFARHRAIMYRHYSWYNIDIGDRQCRFFGHPVTFMAKLKEDVQDFILNKYRLDPVYMGEKELYSFYKQVCRLPICYFYGYPSAIDEFARFVMNNKLDTTNLNISCVITAGETLYVQQRENIAQVFHTKVVNEYGCSEVGIIAFECPEGNMHIADDNLFVEVVKDGVSVPPGETGEIVVTELNNYSVPFIRYALGDIVSISTEARCACGRPFRILKTLEGRTSQVITVPSGRKVHTEVFHYISDVISEQKLPVEQFRVIQKKLDVFEIQIVLTLPQKNMRNCKNEIENLMKKMIWNVLGEGLKLSFVYLDTLTKDKSGKLRYFISEVEQ